MTSDRPTQPPDANGGDDDLEADPLANAPSWARHLDKQLVFLAQRIGEHEEHEDKLINSLKTTVQRAIDNYNDLIARQNRAERLLLSHEAKITLHESRLDSHEGRLGEQKERLDDQELRLKALEKKYSTAREEEVAPDKQH